MAEVYRRGGRAVCEAEPQCHERMENLMTTLVQQLANFISVNRMTDEHGVIHHPEDANEVFRDHMIGVFSSKEFPGLSLLVMKDGSGRLLIDQAKAFVEFETIAELAQQAAGCDEEYPSLGIARFVLGLLGDVLDVGEFESDD